jgi:NADPH:quinone reductase-like Zn-dependent oxidoreductase
MTNPSPNPDRQAEAEAHGLHCPAAEGRACWLMQPGRAEIRTELLPPVSAGHALVRALHSGISRGTETLVFRGDVPAAEFQRMRAPFQAGEFPAPVKYGYASVGIVEQGPHALQGREVFCLYPHQSRYVVPASALHLLPAGVPPQRAVLAASLETAINALWDAPPRIGDHIAVVGAGVIGLLVGWLAQRVPGCRVQVIDIDPAREAVADALGLHWQAPENAQAEAGLVIHTSATESGLATALRLAAMEATVLELSWYGRLQPRLPLGEAFHARRLTLKSSQVGTVAPAQSSAWTHARRLALALELLDNPALDVLITDAAPFDDLPQVLQRLAQAPSATLCHRIDYD